MRRPPRLLFLPLLAGVLLAPSPALPAADEELPLDLSGSWLRDEAASDDAAEKAEEAAAAATPSSGARWGGNWQGGSLGRRQGGRGQGRPQPGRPGQEEPYRRLAKGIEVLQIDHQASQLTITNANRETRVLFTDGRTGGDGFGSRTVAQLSADALVIETTTESGRRIETFRLESPERLVVLTEIQGGGRNRGTRGQGSAGQGRTGQGRGGTAPPGRGAAALPSFEFRTVYERIGDTPVSVRVHAAPPSTAGTAVPPGPGDPNLLPPVSNAPTHTADTPRFMSTDDEPSPFHRGSIIRLLPPARDPGELLRGKVLMQTLTVSPAVATVEFWLDEERVAKKKLPPYEAKIALADPPREQRVKVSAYSASGTHLGDDELVLNRLDPPFRVRITTIDGLASNGSVRVTADVSVPRKAQLERVGIYRGETLVDTLTATDGALSPPFVFEVETPNSNPRDFVRVLAKLEDGRELEDVRLVQGFEFNEQIEVHLVQLQVLVTDRSGTPTTGLGPEDFEVIDGGQKRQVQGLYPSRDVALVLGLAIDSSGSMRNIWQQTNYAARQFLETALADRDRAFLVDFDSQLRLLQPVTRHKEDLYAAMERLQPQGGTALYDSILFSLLQYDGEPGRRALIVLTDGFDSESKADPKRAVEFGQRLGVPVYVIALSQGRRGPVPLGRGGAGGIATNPAMAESIARSQLRLITGPTGGRLFQVGTLEQMEHAFGQIADELRSQYVLTYYTDEAPRYDQRPTVKVLRKGSKVRTALPLNLAD